LAGDGAGALPRPRVVGDAREALPQLDRRRELAPLLEDGADGRLQMTPRFWTNRASAPGSVIGQFFLGDK
jgi:hypothetical protein